MNYKKIKEQVDKAYSDIEFSKNELERLRDECDHPETKLMNYMWAPGHIINDAEICTICGEYIDPSSIIK